MRISLVQKCLLGAVAVAGAVGIVPLTAGLAGSPTAPWTAPLAALVAGCAVGFFAAQSLAERTRRLRDAAERATQGDLGGLPARASRAPDELDDLAAAFVGMLAGLSALVAGLQSGADRLAGAARELSRGADEATGGSEEIATTIAELASGAVRQRSELEEVRQLIHEMAQAVDVNASRAREAFGFAAEANQKAHAGVDVSRLAIEKMRTVFEHVEQAGQRVFQLEAKTRHVHQITEIITSVASRTNLLSLNASIEAARAGEAGRGFAVVADEIRKLAESAARSADEISKLIHEIEADTQSVADEMRQSGQMITEGREDVNTIAASLEQIRAAVGEASARAEEIFQEADKQERHAERVVASVDAMGKASSEGHAAVESAAATATRQVDSAASMAQLAKTLAADADELRTASQRLRVAPPRAAAPEADA